MLRQLPQITVSTKGRSKPPYNTPLIKALPRPIGLTRAMRGHVLVTMTLRQRDPQPVDAACTICARTARNNRHGLRMRDTSSRRDTVRCG